MSLAEEVRSIWYAFPDKERKKAVLDLAMRVQALEDAKEVKCIKCGRRATPNNTIWLSGMCGLCVTKRWASNQEGGE